MAEVIMSANFTSLNYRYSLVKHELPNPFYAFYAHLTAGHVVRISDEPTWQGHPHVFLGKYDVNEGALELLKEDLEEVKF